MTALWTRATRRQLAGTNAFRLMPDDPWDEQPATGVATAVAAGHGLSLHYTWTHSSDGAQDGALLVGSAAEDGTVTAAWIDSWHQQPFCMVLTGRPTSAGVTLRAEYGGSFSWEIDVVVADGLDVTMRNVVPAEAIPDDQADTLKPGPYDVVLLRLR